MNRSAISRWVVWIIPIAIAAYFVWCFLSKQGAKSEDPRSAARLMRVASEINRSVPLMIDKETELMPAEGRQGILIYNYRLVTYALAQLDTTKFAAAVRRKITNEACTRPETRDDFLQKGVTLRYSYVDKDRQHVATVDVTPADCGF